jgi:hypothetical protein
VKNASRTVTSSIASTRVQSICSRSACATSARPGSYSAAQREEFRHHDVVDRRDEQALRGDLDRVARECSSSMPRPRAKMTSTSTGRVRLCTATLGASVRIPPRQCPERAGVVRGRGSRRRCRGRAPDREPAAEHELDLAPQRGRCVLRSRRACRGLPLTPTSCPCIPGIAVRGTGRAGTWTL